jgi:hypothetical protein
MVFQSLWQLVADDVCNFIIKAFKGRQNLSEVNYSLIVLIPKVPMPKFIHQFRPIRLCNVVFKILTKVIVNRIKPLMTFLVTNNQCSFVPGRHTVDNIIVAQEVIDSMRNLKRGRKGFMVTKVDLEKACDRLNWDFIRETLVLAGIPRDMVALIMACIETNSLSVLWNCIVADKFLPARGIRQGDSFSPYIFMLCSERL